MLAPGSCLDMRLGTGTPTSVVIDILVDAKWGPEPWAGGSRRGLSGMVKLNSALGALIVATCEGESQSTLSLNISLSL